MPSTVDSARPQAIAQRAQARRVSVGALAAQLCRLTEPDDRGHVERARSIPALVPASVDERVELRSRDLVSRRTGRRSPSVHTSCARSARRDRRRAACTSRRSEAGRLRGIAMKERALRVRDRRDLAERMQHADFVVGRHRADEQRVVRDGVAQDGRDRSAPRDRRRDTSREIHRARACGTDREPRDAPWQW